MAQAALAGGAVATDMLLAWMLDRQTNGLLQSAFIVTRIAVLAGALGIPTSLYFLYARSEPGERSQLVWQSLGALALAGMFFGGAIWAGAPWLARILGQPEEVVTLLRAGSVAVAVGLPALLAEPLFIVQERVWMAAANALGGAAVQIALVAWVLTAERPPQDVYLALAVASAARLVVPLLYTARRLGRGRTSAPGTAWRVSFLGQAAVAFPIGLTAAIDASSSYIDRAVVARLFGAEELALYRYGAQEVPFIGLVIGALTPVLLPQFSALLQQGKRGEVLEIWHRASAKGAIVLFGILWALVWVAPEFLSVLYSPRYEEAALFFRIYLLLLPLRVVAYMPMLYALGRGRFVALVAAGEVLLNLALALLLIRGAGTGMAGAAWATVIATALQAAIYLTAIRQGLHCRWSDLLPWFDLGRTLIRSALFFAPLGLLKIADLSAPLTVGGAVAWGGVYLYLVALPRLRAEKG